MNVEIAQRLAELRRARGFSQEGLAAELGLSRQAVSKWERSESSPDTDNLIALARLYGVSLDELLYVDDAIADDVAFEAEDRAGGRAVAGASVGATGGADADVGAGAPADPTAADAAPGDASGKGKVRITPAGIHVEDGPDYVHVSWREGVHVVDGAKGEEVRVGWDGVHVRGHDAAGHVFDHEGPGDPFDWRTASTFR